MSDDEYDWSNEKYERATARLRVTNAGLADEIEKLGSSVEFTMARLEHFILFLVEEGVITKGQQVREQHHWEKGLRVQLIAMRDQVKERVQMIRAAQREERRRQIAAAAEAAKPKTVEPPEEKKEGLWVPPDKGK